MALRDSVVATGWLVSVPIFLVFALLLEVSSLVSMNATLWSLAAFIYLVPTVVFLRSEELRGLYKWLYSLFVVPVFLVLMVVNMWALDHLFSPTLDWARAEWSAAVVLPVSVCYGWYVLFARLSRRVTSVQSDSVA
jgi:hypothetical protein